MITLVEVLHVLICLLLIGAVLLQGGENVDITAAFGGTSQAAFGPRGSVTLVGQNHLGAGSAFHRYLVTLAVHASRTSGGSVFQNVPAKTAPVIPVPAKK